MAFWLEFALSFQKGVLDQTLRFFHTKFGPPLKNLKSSYKELQDLALFCILIALILG